MLCQSHALALSLALGGVRPSGSTPPPGGKRGLRPRSPWWPSPAFARLESGRANVQVGTLQAFADALGERLHLHYGEEAAAAG